MLNLNYRGLVLRKLSKMAQMCPKLHSVPVYRRILGQIFFSVIKKNWWHRWHTYVFELLSLVLLTNSCATTSISLGTAWHKWYKHWFFGNYGLAQMYSACATLFVFLKTFLPKNSTIHYKIDYETS